MTEILNKEFTRTSFLKGGGALVVGFSVAGAVASGRAQAATTHGIAAGPLPMNQIDTWITIHADNTATVYTGRIEMGQGTGTSWRQITADELDMSFDQVRFVQPDTHSDPDTGGTNGSTSVQVNGPRVRAAAAYARQTLLGLAATSLGVPVANLTVDKGVVSGGGRSVTYGALLGDKLFNATIPVATLDPGQGVSKRVADYKLVGQRVPRFDIPDKVTGVYTYVHHIRVPGMLHGRIVRMRGQGEYGVPVKPLSVDESSIKHLPSVQVLRKGDFIGVVAPEEYVAIQAAAQLKVKWQTTPSLPSNGGLRASMRSIQTSDRVLTQRGDMSAGFAKASQVLSASFMGPYQVHGSIGPSCSLAQIGPNGGTVFSNTNYGFRMRGKIATMLGLDQNTIRVRYYEGASNFGKCPYDDTTEAASLMSYMLGGKPVRVQFMRWDEHGWDNYGPAQSMDVRAGIDASGKIVAFDFHHWSTCGQTATEPTDEMLRGFTPAPVNSQTTGNMSGGEIYATPSYRFVDHAYNGVNNKSLRGGTLRSPMDPSELFASEQMIDELAVAAKMDPVEFRRVNIGSDKRWLNALDAVVKASNWRPRVSGSSLSDDAVVQGRGIAFGTHKSSWAAVVVDIEVNKKTGKITALHNYAAMDSGLVINPASVENQIVGQQIQGTSRALHEEVVFSKTNVTSLDWVTYPILRIKDHPKVTPIVISIPDQLPQGAGEETLAPVPAAIANAFYDATGVRLRQYPMTASVVRAALRSAGK